MGQDMLLIFSLPNFFLMLIWECWFLEGGQIFTIFSLCFWVFLETFKIKMLIFKDKLFSRSLFGLLSFWGWGRSSSKHCTHPWIYLAGLRFVHFICIFVVWFGSFFSFFSFLDKDFLISLGWPPIHDPPASVLWILGLWVWPHYFLYISYHKSTPILFAPFYLTLEWPNLGRKAFISYYNSIIRSQGRNLKSGTRAETVEEQCLLACFPWCVQLPFLYSSGPPVLTWHHPWWAGPSYISQQ